MQDVNSIENTAKTDVKAVPYVLVVDDNEDIRSYIQHVLKSEYEVDSVADGSEAMDAIKNHMPDLVITDLDMPGVDGLSLVKQMRSDAAMQVLPVIMLSATQDNKARKEAINSGVNTFFKKPFDTSELQRVIKSNLQLVQVRKQTRQMLLHLKFPPANQTLLQAEENLQKYMQLIESLPAAFYFCDASGNIKLYNRASVRLCGFEFDQGAAKWCQSLSFFKLNGEAYAEEQCPLAITFKEGKIVPGEEFIVERPDGTRSNVMPYPEVVFDEEGNVIGGINMLVDISGLK